MPVCGIQSPRACTSILCCSNIPAVPAAMRACIAEVAAAAVGAAVQCSGTVLRAAGADVEGAIAVGVICQVGSVAAAEWGLQLDLHTAG
jgi:hypothetical protein